MSAGQTNPSSQKSDLIPLRIRGIERSDRELIPASSGTVLKKQTATKEVSWESEDLSSQILLILKQLLRQEGAWEEHLAENFTGLAPIPTQLQKIDSSTAPWELWKSQEPEAVLKRADFEKTLRHELLPKAHLKVTGIELTDHKVTTELFAEFANDNIQGTATWICHWLRGPKDHLQLQQFKRRNYEELRGKTNPIFTDVAATVLGKTPHYTSQIHRGITDWADEISRFSDLSLTGHHGIAVGDVDGDGREDLFVCDGGGLPNRLYRQCADGSAEDISKKAGLDWYEDSRSALLLDLDNDGDQDLVVATIAMITFCENDGTGRFTLRGGFPGAQYPFSMAAADYDLDGDLDLYLCLYGEGDNATGERGFDSRSPVPFEDARNGGRNVLLENRGDFTFADVTKAVGLEQNNDRWSFAASWEDYDRDGDSDLYVANDFGTNTLYRNDGGRFIEIANATGVEDTAAGMSVSWGDFNRDGHFDLYLGNMFSSAGGRVSRQKRFAPGREEAAISSLQGMAQGNSLFAGGRTKFLEVPQAAGASMGRWSWSSGFVDLNNDGWEDLVITNGYLSGWENKEDL